MSITRQLQLVILFAIITRLLLLYSFPLHMTDFMLINSAAENLINGHGMGFYRSSPEDLSFVYFEGLRLWPPLVTVTTAVFLKLTGSYNLADMLMLSIILLALVRVLYLYCKEIGLSTIYICYVFLFLGINPELIKHPGFSDLTAALFTIWSLLALTRELKKENNSRLIQLFSLSFLFFLPSAFRYQYYPISLLFPCYLLAAAFYLKNKKLAYRSFTMICLVLTLLILQETFLFYYTNQPMSQSVAMDKTGIFLFNLADFYPFFYKSFVNLSYIENTWSRMVHSLHFVYDLVSNTMYIALIAVTLNYFIQLVQKQKKENNEQKLKQTLSAFTTIPFSLFPVLILIALSLTHNSRNGLPGGWTYVLEGRYYIVTSILILLLLLWYVQQKWNGFASVTKRIFPVLFILIVLYNLSLTVKFCYNVAKGNIPDKELKNRTERATAYNYFKQLSNDSLLTVITYREPYFIFFPHLNNIVVTKNISLLNGEELRTKKKIRLLIVSTKDALQTDLELIKKYNAVPVLTRSGYIIYSTILNPE